jgi:hypothetical protein
MDLGLSGYHLGLGPLAQSLNARWAQFSVNVLAGDEGRADIVATLVDDIDSHGCRPILDARGTLDDFARIVTNIEHCAAWQNAVDQYTDAILRILDAEPRIQELEVWGSADLPIIVGGHGPQFDASTVLAEVHAQVKEAFPAVRVLSGGYGINADCMFVQFGLAEHAPEGFDVCNLHPLPLPCETLEVTLGVYAERLDYLRKLVAERCAGQPFASTGFGIPTLATAPPPDLNIGTHWQLPGGVRGVTYAEAADWYKAMLDCFEAFGFEYVCLIAEDVLRGGKYMHWQAACGLLKADGRPKSFVDALVQWAQERQPFEIEEE